MKKSNYKTKPYFCKRTTTNAPGLPGDQKFIPHLKD